MTSAEEAAQAPGDVGIICVTLNPALDRTYEVHNLEFGQHTDGRLVSVQPAGKAVNVARALQHLGRRCILTGFVGDDDRRTFESSFDSTIVKAELFGIAGRTRDNVTLMDVERNIETHIRDQGGKVTDDDRAKLLRKLKILCRNDGWAIFAGSLPPGMVAAELLEMLIAVDRGGCRIILDSSGGMRMALGKVPVWLIKPNREELGDLTGEDVSNEQAMLSAARKLLDRSELVLVSAGGQGAYLVSREEMLHAYMKELPQAVTNTVGCGDALLAGFVDSLAAGGSLRDALRRAVAVATSALFMVRAGEVDPEEVSRLVDKVTIYRIN